MLFSTQINKLNQFRFISQIVKEILFIMEAKIKHTQFCIEIKFQFIDTKNFSLLLNVVLIKLLQTELLCTN